MFGLILDAEEQYISKQLSKVKQSIQLAISTTNFTVFKIIIIFFYADFLSIAYCLDVRKINHSEFYFHMLERLSNPLSIKGHANGSCLIVQKINFRLVMTCQYNKLINQMLDNFFEDNYHSYDKVYKHPETERIIYLGDMQSALDIDFLHNHNIKTVITAAKDMDHIVFSQYIKHIVYPLIDGKNQNIAGFFEQFYQLIEQSSRKGNILVHCAAGISRSSTLVISYVMKKQRMNFKEAIALVRKGRPNVLPNLGFQRQLKAYEKVVAKQTPLSRNSKRSEVKTSQSSKRPYLNKCQILSNKLKDRVISLNMKRLMEKYSDKELQILKIYNHKKLQFASKPQLKKMKPLNSNEQRTAALNQLKVELPKRDKPLVQVADVNKGIAKYRKRIKTRVFREENQTKNFMVASRYNKSIEKVQKSVFI